MFDDILHKDKLERNDLELLIDRILVYEDHLEIKLQADIDSLLHCGTIEECRKEISAANFNFGTENIENTISQSSKNHGDKVFRVNVVSNGDPLCTLLLHTLKPAPTLGLSAFSMMPILGSQTSFKTLLGRFRVITGLRT